MYVVMKCFKEFQIPEMVFGSEERAIEYVQQNEMVFFSYEIKYVEFGG